MVRVLQLEVVGGMSAAGSPCTHKNSASNWTPRSSTHPKGGVNMRSMPYGPARGLLENQPLRAGCIFWQVAEPLNRYAPSFVLIATTGLSRHVRAVRSFD